jgi:beta-lactamase class A
MRFFSFFFLCCLMAGTSLAQPDVKLQRQIDTLVKGFRGEVGVYVKNLRTGKTVAVNADTVFPTASMVKVPIMIGIMDKINRGELKYHQPLTYKDSLLYAGEDILGSFKTDEKIELSKVIMLMLTTSDNTASLWLQSLAGTGTRINQLLDSMGFTHTRVNSRTPGREANRGLYGWGQTTPREMVTLFEKMYNGQLLGDSTSRRMLRLLGRNYWDEEAIGEIPPTVFVASKNGAVNASRSETLLVMAPGNPYIFSIITKNQQDVSWEANNEGWVLARKLSALLWKQFGGKKGK